MHVHMHAHTQTDGQPKNTTSLAPSTGWTEAENMLGNYIISHEMLSAVTTTQVI